MQRAVDAARFGDAVVILWSRVVVAGLQFFEGKLVGRVPIGLVATEKDENRLRAVLARGLQQIQRAHGVHFEIEQRNIARLVMRRLRGTVHDEVEVARAE